ncbi:MAG: hypothetical protein WD096_07870 [Actinomycetota bacterium]
MEPASCIGFNVACDVILKGAGVTIAGLLLFVGSVYVLLSAVFGRWMGYLVVMVAFSGWMLVLSSLWLWGFWSLGPETTVNLGPRGTSPSWLVVSAGLHPENTEARTEFASYPGAPWETVAPTDYAESEPQAISGAAVSYLADIANEELGRHEFDQDAVSATQFTVDTLAVAQAEDGTDLAVVQAHFIGGGPSTTLSMAYDDGSEAIYGWLFLVASGLVFAIHLPLLDRAERSRTEFLTGGNAPAWYGPA